MRSARLAFPIGYLLAALGGATTLHAHEVRPGYLELTETGPGRFDVFFKLPLVGGSPLRLEPVLPAACTSLTPVSRYVTPSALLQRWSVRCGPLAGQRIAIAGLQSLLTEVLLRIQTADGRTITARLRPVAPFFVVPSAPSAWGVARTYLALGIGHILGGIDHLLFVLALILMVRGTVPLIKTITAFTVAHSITLAAATLGLVRLPGKPVEAFIALSIMFLASELVHSGLGRPGLTQRWPWIVAFTFGLVHGLGFAGALAEIGLPQRQIPLALFLFNGGVEVGQLLFVAVVLVVTAGLRRLPIRVPPWTWRVPAYAIGSVAAFWVLERITAF
jgi:hypothetical protein